LNNYKVLGIPLAILLITTIISIGFITNSAYAHGSKVKVGCKDLALALITWDSLYPLVDGETISEIEDDLDSEGIKPSLLNDIVDEHMEDLLDDFEDANCKHLDDDIEEWIDRHVDFERRD
jgi:hypothetical protein